MSPAISRLANTQHKRRKTHRTSQSARRRLQVELLEDRRLLAVNQPPINTVPGPQETIETVPLAFTAYRQNQISVFDPDAGENPIRVRLEAQHGMLSFAYPDPPGGELTYVVGDGTTDPVIEVIGPQAIINETMRWVYYTPPTYHAVQWKAENGGNDHWYEYVSGTMTWTEARDFANSRGGYLATLTSQAETNFVNSLVPSSYPWIGGYQDRNAANYSEPHGGWRWVTGELWDYQNWYATSPNNLNGNEDYLHLMNTDKKWNDWPVSNRSSLLIEYETTMPSETTLTIITNDQGYFGTGGPKQDVDTIHIDLQKVEFNPSPEWPTIPAAFDNSFDGDGRQVLSVSSGLDIINDMVQLSDGKLLAVGAVNNRFGMLRFNSDLTLDTSFGTDGVVESNFGDGRHAYAVEIDREGRYLVGGNSFLARYLPSGQLDTSFGANGLAAAGDTNPIYDIKIQADSKILTTGSNNERFRVSRYFSDGTPDSNWAFYDVGSGSYQSSRSIQNDDTGDMLIVGRRYKSDFGPRLRVTRLGVTGAYEDNFDYNFPGDEFYNSSILLPDGKILVVGHSNGDVTVTRHLATAEIDTTFGSNGSLTFPGLTANDQGWRATLQSDGKILLTGQAHNGVNWDILVARLSYDGVLDTTFNTTGVRAINLGADDYGYAVISQPDGKIVIAGRSGDDIALVRLYGDNDIFGERPYLDPIGDYSIDEDHGNLAIDLTGIRSGGEGGRPLRVTATSSFEQLIPTPTITYESPQSTGVLTLLPADNRFGSSAITVHVEDGGEDGDLDTADDNRTFYRRFTVTVSSVNDAPTLDSISNLEMDENGGQQEVLLDGITAGGGESQPLRVTASSNAPSIIPNPVVRYDSPEVIGQLFFRPLPNMNGTVTITVRVEDGGLDNNLATTDDNASFERSFNVVVNAVNYPPSDIEISETLVTENVPVGTVVATLSTVDNDPEDSHVYSLVSGSGGTHNDRFRIEGNQLITTEAVDWENLDFYHLRIRSVDSSGLSLEKQFVLNVIDLPELHESPIFGDGTAQRSMITEILVTFDEDVEIQAGAFALSKRGANGGDVTTSFVKRVNAVGRTEVLLTFSGEFTRGSLNALVDGNYQFTIDGTKIKRNGLMLDADRDGIGGDTFNLGDDAADGFYALYGDVNGDRAVGFADFIAFRSAFGKSQDDDGFNPILDYTGDGSIGFADFISFRTRFGSTLDFE